ncbi:hypothetical protein [Fusibacter sp. A1]
MAVYCNEAVVGMARLIWNGGSIALIVGLLVIPEFRTKGVEKLMLTKLS